MQGRNEEADRCVCVCVARGTQDPHLRIRSGVGPIELVSPAPSPVF